MDSNTVPADVRWAIANFPDGPERGAVSCFCRRNGISRSAFYKIRSQAREKGPVGATEPGSRRPPRSPRRIDPGVIEHALAVRDRLGGEPVREVTVEMPEDEVEIVALDGVVLRGSFARPVQAEMTHAVLLVHGGGVTRDEGGFFRRLARGLGEAGIASLRVDLRGHGTSGGRQEDLTGHVIMNDIRVSLEDLKRRMGVGTSLLGASFTGGFCAAYAARRPGDIERLVLLNPQLDYRARTISPPWWEEDRLVRQGAEDLDEQGWIQFRPSLRHGRAIFHEAFWFEVELERVTTPTLLVHGTQDTLVPISMTRDNAPRIGGSYRLHEIEGAQHGFAVHDDPTYAHPQSQVWQAEVISLVTAWVRDGPDDEPHVGGK